MGTKWTKEQQTVIDLRNCNILVSAAAGSGKTAVLVERILSMLIDPVHPIDIDRLLIVTFTNAAAGEMRDRIRTAIEQKLEAETDQKMAEHLMRQTSLLSHAQICTIHSFCQYVIKNYFHTTDLDPDFRIADEGEQKLIKNDVMRDLIEEKYVQQDPEFLRMTECIATGRDDKKLEDMIFEIFDFSESFPWPLQWLERCMDDYCMETEEEFLSSEWMHALEELLQNLACDAYRQAEYALSMALEEHGPYMYEAALQSDLEFLNLLRQSKDYRQWAGYLAGMGRWKTLSSKKDDQVSDELREKVKSIREQYKGIISDIKKVYFYAPPKLLYEQIKVCEPFMKQLMRVTEEFSCRYAEGKRNKNLCDFSDLEHFALEILVKQNGEHYIRTEAAMELAGQYEEILIDEYQDSNLVQEMILTSISRMEEGRNNVFMVGDVKQSIYRFRQARPELFMEKFDTYSLAEGNCRRIDLHKNFRSRSQVLDSVNELFERIMAKNLGNVEYDEAAKLNVGAVFEEGVEEALYQSEVMLLGLTADDLAVSEENAKELEARMVGNRILQLAGHQMVWDKEKNTYRPAGFGDIVILLRTISGWAEVFTDVLRDMGIPSYAGSRTGYFSAPEVQNVLAFLKILDNPYQDIPMAAVLNSPMADISAEQLASLRSREKSKPFYQVCMEAEELKDFFEMVNLLRKKAAYTPMHDLLWEIFECTGYDHYAAAMPGGEQRKANLDMLVEKAAVYEDGSYHGLYNFIRYIENLHKYDVDFGEAGVGNQGENMVRIMSIHKSKGLEFPIVIAAGMGKEMNQMDVRGTLVFHADRGIGCDLTDPLLRVRSSTLFKNYLKQLIRNEDLGEELRVLYVALTRAKEKLILSGTVGGLEKKWEKWDSAFCGSESVLSFSDRISAKTYLDWIMPVLLKNSQLSFSLNILKMQDLIIGEKERQLEEVLREERLRQMKPGIVFDEAARERIREDLGYQYPFKKDFMIPSKISVSELKKISQEEMNQESHQIYADQVPVPCIPEFLREEKEIGGAGRGTIYHKFMECLDFEEAPASELQRMIKEGILSEEAAALLDLEKLEKFCESELADRMCKAQKKGQLYREQQFVLEVTASEINPDWSSDETVLIQGIIDAYFIEGDHMILVDYKTDSVKLKEASSLYEKYRVQLDYYKKALERLTEFSVSEQLIYSFCLNREVTGSVNR